MIRNYAHYWHALVNLSNTVDLVPLVSTFGMPSNASLESIVWKYTCHKDGDYHNHVFRVWCGQYLVSKSTGYWAWEGKVQEVVDYDTFHDQMLAVATKNGWKKRRPTSDALDCLRSIRKVPRDT